MRFVEATSIRVYVEAGILPLVYTLTLERSALRPSTDSHANRRLRSQLLRKKNTLLTVASQCIGDDTKGAAGRSPNCIRNTENIFGETAVYLFYYRTSL